MKTNISRWIILLLTLACTVQAVSALGFDVKAETINPEGDTLEPGQRVIAHYVLTYNMFTTGSGEGVDETIKFTTGLRDPSWKFTVFRSGNAAYTTENPILSEFDLTYGKDAELHAQLEGTVPPSTSGTILVTKIEHRLDTDVKKTHSVTRKVVSAEQVGNSLAIQQQRLKNLRADIDDRAARGVDVSPAQVKYNIASQALTSAASAAPSKAAEHIASAIMAIDEASSLLDRAWAVKEVSNTAAAIEDLDSVITYFVEDHSMRSDPQVVAIMTIRESAVQFYSQAKDALNMNNYPLARLRASDGLRKVNEALADTHAFHEKLSSGSLDIRSTPSAANIYIDGTYRGATPDVVPGLSAGSYQVRILRNGYDDYTLITTVTAGKTTVISATLTPISTSIQQQNLKNLKADIDARAAEGVEIGRAHV